MAGNSQPLRWDTPSPNGLWAMEIGDRWSEAEARAFLEQDLGEVDEQFIHIIPYDAVLPSDERFRGISYMLVSRRETDGLCAA